MATRDPHPTTPERARVGPLAAAPILWLLNAPLAWLGWIYAMIVAAIVPQVIYDTPQERILWWDATHLVCATVALAQWLQIARMDRDAVRISAALIAAGVGIWWASEIVWVVCDILGSDAAQFPSPLSMGFVAFLPLFGFGLVVYIQRAVRRWFTVPLICDFGVLTATLIVVVGFPMNDLLRAAAMPINLRLPAIGYPVLGLVLAAFNLYCLVAFGWGARRWVLSLLLLGGLVILGADFAYAAKESFATFAPDILLDPLWSVGFGLISLAAFEHNRIRETGSAPPIEATERRLRRLRQFMPPAAMVAIVVTLISHAKEFSAGEGVGILVPAVLLLAASMASASLWHRRHIANLEGQTDAAHAAWRKAEARFGALLEFSPDPTVVVDRHGRIRAAGKGAEIAFGLPRAALLRQPLSLLSPDFETALPRAVLARVAEGGSRNEARFELVAQRRNGSTFPAEGVAFGLEDDGHLIGLVLRDVTQARAVEQQLRTSKEAAELADRSKSEFLANMSHELRTPLNAIIGFADIIEAQSFGPGDPRYADYARDIGVSGRHLLGLLKDILDFSRIETGNASLREGQCDLAELVASSLRILDLRAREAEIGMRTALPEDLPAIYGDAVKLKQVMLNLLSNAIKFTPKSGTVTVGAGLLPDGSLAVTVADTGIGMRRQDIPRALSPFGQISNAFSRGHDGLGLGLPLARQLIELHDGRLEIESEPGKGTAVTFVIAAERLLARHPELRAAHG